MKLLCKASIEVLKPPTIEKLAIMNMVQSAMPRLVDLARDPNLNSGRERICDRRKMACDTIYRFAD